MSKGLLQSSQLEVVKFLYQFKDDNKYYKIEHSIIETASHEESHGLLYTLRDRALIATDCEIHDSPAKTIFKAGEIRAKILPKGIAAIETVVN